jgi:hypothetical protein
MDINFDDLGPPPPGSVFCFWDTLFSTSCIHNFPSRVEDATCWSLDTESTGSESLSSVDTYASANPVRTHPNLSLTRVTVTPCLIGLTSDPECNHVRIGGHLVDNGGNFNMTTASITWL